MKSTTRLFVVCALVAPVSLFCQTATPAAHNTDIDPVVRAQQQAAFRQGMTDATALAQGGRPDLAQQRLTQLNRAKPDTAAWHFETAQRLVHLAEDLAREAHIEAVLALVTIALQNLALVDRLATNTMIRTSAQLLAGYIYENYRGDRAAAMASYQAAVQADPTSGQANEAVARLQDTAAALQNEGGPKS